MKQRYYSHTSKLAQEQNYGIPLVKFPKPLFNISFYLSNLVILYAIYVQQKLLHRANQETDNLFRLPLKPIPLPTLPFPLPIPWRPVKEDYTYL